MVILQFNKLIRNKWVWGVFAVAVSAAFCFDDLFTTRQREERQIGEAGKLAGVSVKASVFNEIADEVRGFGQNRDWRRKSWEVNRQAWEIYAMLDVAEANGLTATDKEVAEAIRRERSFQGANGFNFDVYQRVLAENSLTPERFEAFLKRRLTMVKLGEAVLAGAASWASPMELDQAVNDMTDAYTIQVARFEQDAKKAAAVKIDDAGVKKWYEEHVKELALPERAKLRFVKFDATKPELLAKMTVTEDEMRDRYDVTTDRYTSTDTNGVETVKAFDEVKGEIEAELRQIAAVQCLETNLNRRAYGVKAAAGASRLDEIAKEEGLQVATSDWFATDGSQKQGFTRSPSQICPGSENFLEAVAELDPESEDLRYGIVLSPKTVWLVERAALSPAHEPTFEEAKEIVRPRALEAAKADAFKRDVEAVIAKGAAEVLKAKNVSTNMTFAICDLSAGAFPDQTVILRATSKLSKGQVSGFNQTGLGKALVVVCQDRQPGDAAKAMVFRAQVRADVEMLQRRQIPEAWQKWNLDQLGFEPGEGASVTVTTEEE